MLMTTIGKKVGMGIKMCNSGKNLLHTLFKPLTPSVPFLYSLKKVFDVFRGYKKGTRGGNGLIAYGNYFFKATSLTF